jgi:hypothetical protein
MYRTGPFACVLRNPGASFFGFELEFGPAGSLVAARPRIRLAGALVYILFFGALLGDGRSLVMPGTWRKRMD